MKGNWERACEVVGGRRVSRSTLDRRCPSLGGSGVGVRYIRSWRAESQSPVSDESKCWGGEGSMGAIDHATGRMVKTV
jgi:hypothetical protein